MQLPTFESVKMSQCALSISDQILKELRENEKKKATIKELQ